MEKDLFHLERLLETSAILPVIQKDRRCKLNKKPWLAVRESARSLFTAFTKRWRCTCTSTHNMLLRLDIAEKSKNDPTNVRFNVLLSNRTLTSGKIQLPLTWYSLGVDSKEESKKVYV